MNAQTVIAMVSLALALLSSVAGGLWYAFKIGALVTELSAAVARLAKLEARAELVPVMSKELEQQREVLEEISRRVSEFPRYREKVDSLVEDIKEANLPELRTTVEVMRRSLQSRGQMPAVRVPRPAPREDPDDDDPR